MKHWYDRQGFPPVQTIGLGPVRVGIVSSTFHDHSVWRAFVKGWMQHFDPSKIETHIFYFPVYVDAETEWAKSRAASFQTITRDTSATVRVILGKQLDILIYPDIGMDGAILKLASLRLCDVQMASWGHPQTTGLPTIDYYISANDLEPVDAEDHYSEKLIRLPNLGCCYQKLEPPEQPVDGTAFGLKKDIPLLIAPGMSFKYAPENDHVFVDIARRMGGQCQILFFISHDGLSEILRDRLSKAFETEGLEFSACCRFIAWQNKNIFHGLMRQADVYLDTIGFSGFNTAMQAVECGLPIVTQEGAFMRGRLASGILYRMDLSELVAADNHAYIDLAVKLASDPIYRQNLVQKFVEQRGILFEDREPVLALQNKLIGLLKNSASIA